LIQSGEISSEGINAYEVSGELPPVGATIIVSNGEVLFTNLFGNLADVLTRDASALLDAGATTVRHYGRNGQAKLSEVEVLFETFAPPPRMIIFGAVDFTASLARLAKMLGFRVSVCDARPLFATKARFPMADEVVVDWPDRYISSVASSLSGRDAICVLTHDPKFDVPAITAALNTQVGYVGAMGSRRTHEERTKRLVDVGVDIAELEDRVYGPIGLDIGARTPEETAVSILGEIIANRSRRFASSLSRGDGPIHNR
jgi:xanthine dehydrogenase accessory factor